MQRQDLSQSLPLRPPPRELARSHSEGVGSLRQYSLPLPVREISFAEGPPHAPLEIPEGLRSSGGLDLQMSLWAVGPLPRAAHPAGGDLRSQAKRKEGAGDQGYRRYAAMRAWQGEKPKGCEVSKNVIEC